MRYEFETKSSLHVSTEKNIFGTAFWNRKERKGHLYSHLSIVVCLHAKQTQLILYNYNNNAHPPPPPLHVIVYVCYWLGSWDSNMPWHIFMVNAHNTKEQTSWRVNKKDLIFSWHYHEVKFTSIWLWTLHQKHWRQLYPPQNIRHLHK